MSTSREQTDGLPWLITAVPLDLADGSHVVLEVRQDISDSLQRERLLFWLFVLAMGVSALFTSALFRLVMYRGLVGPLQEFTDQLNLIRMPPHAEDSIDVLMQPEELQPIATAFNSLHQRLCLLWQREQAFVDGVAHELRTPITLISGHAQHLLRQPAFADVTPLRLISHEAVLMSSLVADLLDLARNEAGRLTLQAELIHGEDMLIDVYERLVPKVEGRLRLKAQAPDAPELPAAIGDRERLEQCLLALVDNALKYSEPSDPVSLSCEQGADGNLVFHVCDQGPGVPLEERSLIFERFVRGSAAAHYGSRGSGIGLSVVRLLMVAMGGSVQVADAEGGGADFQLHLPMAESSELLPSP